MHAIRVGTLIWVIHTKGGRGYSYRQDGGNGMKCGGTRLAWCQCIFLAPMSECVSEGVGE